MSCSFSLVSGLLVNCIYVHSSYTTCCMRLGNVKNIKIEVMTNN